MRERLNKLSTVETKKGDEWERFPNENVFIFFRSKTINEFPSSLTVCVSTLQI